MCQKELLLLLSSLHTLYFFPFFHQSRKIPRVQIKDDLMRRSFQETFAYIADRRLLELLLVGLDWKKKSWLRM